MIIDIHTHLMWGEIVEGGASTPQSADKALAAAQRLGIDAVCQLGNFWGYPTQDGIREINDLTIAMVKRQRARVYGLCFLNLNLPWKDVEAEFNRCMAAGLHGVKLEYEVNARDPRLDPLMEMIVERDVFLLHHAWYKTTHKYPHESDPSDVAHLGARHPKARILMAHLTAAGMRGVLDIAPHANISIDTSGSQPFAGIVEYAVARLGAERVLFGSDAIGRDFSCQLGRVLGAELTDRQRELILAENAARLLKIDVKNPPWKTN